jgi:hypothetical protein
VLQGANRLQHLELRATGVSAGPLRELTSLRSLALDASALTHPSDRMDLLSALQGLTYLQVIPVFVLRRWLLLHVRTAGAQE